MFKKILTLIVLIIFLGINILVYANQQENSANESSQVGDKLDNALSNLTNQIITSISTGKGNKIAVIEFSDLDGNVTKFGKYIAEELITRFFMARMFEVVERQLLNKVMSEQKLSVTGLIDIDSAKELGKILGVDAIVSGTVTDLGSSIKINARIISTETGSVFGAAQTKIIKDAVVRKLIGEENEDKIDVAKKDNENKTKETEKKDKSEQEEQLSAKQTQKFQKGLKAEYFNLPPFDGNLGNLPDKPTYTRIDNSINFDWGGGIPAPNISADYFGVRWTGYIHIPITGTYLFRLHRQDGARLFIDNIALFEDWHRSSAYNRYNDYKDKNIFLKGDK